MNNEEVKVVLAKLIGCEYTEATKAEITKLTGRVRVVGPMDVGTLEVDESRIHVIAGDDGVITGFRFG